MNHRPTTSPDVLVIGAALNGLAAAVSLGGRHVKRTLNVVLIDAKDPRSFASNSFDGRASAITANPNVEDDEARVRRDTRERLHDPLEERGVLDPGRQQADDDAVEVSRRARCQRGDRLRERVDAP